MTITAGNMEEYKEYLDKINDLEELKQEVLWIRNLIMLTSGKASELLDQKLELVENKLLSFEISSGKTIGK